MFRREGRPPLTRGDRGVSGSARAAWRLLRCGATQNRRTARSSSSMLPAPMPAPTPTSPSPDARFGMIVACRCTSAPTATHRWSRALRSARSAVASWSDGRPASTPGSVRSPRNPGRPSGPPPSPRCCSSWRGSPGRATGCEPQDVRGRVSSLRPGERRVRAARPGHAVQRGDSLLDPDGAAAGGRRGMDRPARRSGRGTR